MSTNTPHGEDQPRPLSEALDHLDRAVQLLGQAVHQHESPSPRVLLDAGSAAGRAVEILEAHLPIVTEGRPVRAEAEGAE